MGQEGYRDSAGIGVGLTIASRVAATHGGEVKVDSQEGRGSTFVLRVPAGPATRVEQVRQAG